MTKLRFLTAGESHGPSMVAIIEGIPAGLNISVATIQKELDKRRSGAGRGGRGIIEKDQVKILSGVRFGKTLGSPIALIVDNLDFVNWSEKMSIETITTGHGKPLHLRGDIASHLGISTQPRPGHADLAGALKYGFDDIRNVLERASARETIMRVAVGAICKIFLRKFNIEIASHTIQIGQIMLNTKSIQFDTIKNVFNNDPEIRCIDPSTSLKMKETILEATRTKNTLGGVIEIIAHNIPVGLGSYVHFDRKIDGRLAQMLMSIPSVKAVEIGEGIENTKRYGQDVHDDIYFEENRYVRKTNSAGGIEGGVTNGEDIILRVFHKPISTLGNPKDTIDIKTKKPTKAFVERSDICVVPRAGVISESMVAYVLVDEILQKFGGDNIEETKRNFKGYIKSLK